MCYYKLFIFQGCGHTVPSVRPVYPCTAATAGGWEEWQGMRKQTIAARNAGKEAEHSDTNVSVQAQPQTQPPQPREWDNEEERTRIPETVAGATHRPPPSARSSAVSAISAAQEEEPCTAIHTHPFQTTRIYRSCAFCTRAREVLLAQSESEQPRVRFDDRRWKIKLVNRKAWGTRNSTSNSSILSGGGSGSVGSQSGVGGEADWSQIGDVMGSWVKKRWPGS